MNKIYFLKLLMKISLFICVIVFVILILAVQSSSRRAIVLYRDHTDDDHRNFDNRVKTVKPQQIIKYHSAPNNSNESVKSFETTTHRLGLREPHTELWRLIVKRYWNLTKDLVKPNVEEIQASNLTDYFINKSEYTLWRPYNHFDSESRSGFVDSDRIVPQLVFTLEGHKHKSLENAQMKQILLYDSFAWWKYDGEFWKNCPGWKTKCRFVNGRSTKGIDAVVTTRDSFHYSNVEVDAGVKRFYFILESPLVSEAELTRENDLLTSFWRGSDLITPYGKWVYYDPDVRSTKQDINYAAGKTKMAAIFVSNCNAANQRMRYVHELKQHIEVDVFGDCGSKNCPRGDGSCFPLVKKEYKFYLSFENANCRDYISEKFFNNALSNNVIPIVLGGETEDYVAAAPENSFLHVSNFTSAKGLAEYMTELASNDEKYGKYFEWKGTGAFISTNYLCRVCAMLHYSDLVPPPKRTETFSWSSQELCTKRDKYYWQT